MEAEREEPNNKKAKCLTIVQLRAFKGFENYTDEQAEDTIRTLEKLSILFYNLHMRSRQVVKIHKLNYKTDKRKKKQIKGGKDHEDRSGEEQPDAA